MKVIVTAIGSSGDVFPLTGIGVELRRRGHEVVVLTNEHFEPFVRGCGLGFESIGTEEEYQQIMADPDLWHPMKGFRTVMTPTLEHLVPRIAEKVMRHWGEGREMAVVGHTLDFASLCLQERYGIPVVTVHLAPALFRSEHEMPTMTGAMNLSWLPRGAKRMGWWVVDWVLIDGVVGPRLNAFRAGLGLGPVRRPFQEWIHSPLLTLGLFPEWFAGRQPDWPGQMRQTGFPLFEGAEVEGVPGELERFLGEGERPIVFTPGSAVKEAGAFVRAAVEACQLLGRRGVILAKFASVGDLPPTVTHFSFAPLGRILSRCAALVHHGGIGTTAAGFAGGVPQVVMPMSHDQPDHAARVKTLGVGERVFPKAFTGRRVAEALGGLLGSGEVKERCEGFAKLCAGRDGLKEAGDWIEEAVENRKGRVLASS